VPVAFLQATGIGYESGLSPSTVIPWYLRSWLRRRCGAVAVC
jgi:hypothetical protein